MGARGAASSSRRSHEVAVAEASNSALGEDEE